MLCLASLAFALCVNFAILKSRDWLLTRDAQSTGMDWARHLEARIPNLAEIIENGPEAKKLVPKADYFTGLVREVLSLGYIYQIDFINANCLCELTFGSFSDPEESLKAGLSGDHESHAGADSPDHRHNEPAKLTVPNQGLVSHVFTGRKSHPPMKTAGASALRLPVDRALMQTIIAKASNDIYLRTSAPVAQPSTFAEVYHPITANGETVYVVRVLVDLAARADRYNRLLYTGAILIVVLLALAFWFPARQLLKTTTKQRISDEKARYLALHDQIGRAHV